MVTLVHIMWLKRIHHTLEPIIAAYSLILTFLTGISYLTLLTAALLLCCLKGQEDWTETKMQGWTLLSHSLLCVQYCYSSRWIEEIWSLANTTRQKSPSSKRKCPDLFKINWTTKAVSKDLLSQKYRTPLKTTWCNTVSASYFMCYHCLVIF